MIESFSSEAAPIVDVHCHMFNAADIPMRGFVRHVVLRNGPLSAQLAGIAARLTAGAPGYVADMRRIDGLFGGFETASATSVAEHFDEEVNEVAQSLSVEERQLITVELKGAAGFESSSGGVEGFSVSAVKRFVAWAKLFSQSRADLALLYARYFDPSASVAIPMLVDLASGVDDYAATGLDQQVTLFDRLSEASMRGVLPGAENLRLHPFVSFDPFRVVDGHRAADGRPIRDVIEDALLNRGFVGVKVYPEMGWRASGNTAANAGTAERATRLNALLDEFFGWCAAKSIPITAHCNHSNFPNDPNRDAGYGAPDEWLPVLRDHPELRVNLGHFGGAHDDERAYSWAWDIANAMSEFPGRLFGDVGCHPAYDEPLMAVHFSVLRRMVDANPAVRRQLMFGTDWYMEANNEDAEHFTATYQRLYRDAFGDGQTVDDFMGRNALRFLGFSTEGFDGNGARLRQRYADVGAPPPTWLNGPADGPDT